MASGAQLKKKHMRKAVRSKLLSILIGCVMGGLGLALTLSLAFFAGSVFGAISSSLPASLLMYAAVAALSKSDFQTETFDRSILVTAMMYIALGLSALVFALTDLFLFKKHYPDMSWNKRTWLSFGIGISIWVICVIVLLVLYYTNEDFYNRFKRPDELEDNVEDE